jgi:hypothetical protein
VLVELQAVVYLLHPLPDLRKLLGGAFNVAAIYNAAILNLFDELAVSLPVFIETR